MRYGLMVSVVAALWGATASGQTLRAYTYQLAYNDTSRTVAFAVEFNRRPDFYAIGPGGAQADSFQFVLDTIPGNNGMGGASPMPWETVVRGEEIHEHSLVPVRDHIHGPSSQPGSGGWGPVVVMLDYELVGTRLSFRASYESLGTPDGRFRYELHLYEQGSWTGRAHAGFTVPAPAGVLTLCGAAVLVPRRRQRREGTTWCHRRRRVVC